MTRKRFIKLMMARGYSRNTAAAQAAQVSRYGSYWEMYLRIMLVPEFTQALPDMIRMVCAGLSTASEAASAALSSLAESFRRMADG